MDEEKEIMSRFVSVGARCRERIMVDSCLKLTSSTYMYLESSHDFWAEVMQAPKVLRSTKVSGQSPLSRPSSFDQDPNKDQSAKTCLSLLHNTLFGEFAWMPADEAAGQMLHREVVEVIA